MGKPWQLGLLLLPCLACADPLSEGIEGRWLVPAHGSDKPAVIISVKIVGDRLSSRIDSLIGRPADARCGKRRGDRKGRPVLGMEILRDFVFAEWAWKGGYLPDPESGREFSAEIPVP